MKDFEEDLQFEEFNDEDFVEIDALIEYLNTLPRHEVFMLNNLRVLQMRFACATIKKVLRETRSAAKIECKQHEFDPNVGVVRVEGASLNVVDIEGFVRASEFASNTEIYPLSTNKVRMTFTFHGMLMPI